MLTQRLANKFPIFTKVRSDPSSLGYRLLSTWGEYFDYAYADDRRQLEDTKLLRHGLSLGRVYQVYLEEEDALDYTIDAGGLTTWVYPTVVGTADSVEYTCDRVDNLEDLLWSVPDRFTESEWAGINNLTIYTDNRSGTIVNNDIEYPDNLLLVVTGSLDYKKKTRLRNVKASGQHAVVIKGRDINGDAFTEYVYVQDDGPYRTRNAISEITEVIPEGFDGDISISVLGGQTHLVDPFRICVTVEGEGPGNLRMSSQVSGSTYARLFYYTNILNRGEDYRDGSVEVVPNEQEAWEQYLVSATDTAYTPIDMAINPNSTRLYVLDSTGGVHLYEHKPTVFDPPSLEDTVTKTTYVEVLPVKPWARIDETMQVFTRHARVRYVIRGVQVKRISPSAVVEYLQANKTWSASVYEFPGREVLHGLPEESWDDLAFTSLFDEFGQWEFYVTTRTDIDTTVSYTGVMVDKLQALRSIDTGVTNPIRCFFAHDDRFVVLSSDAGPIDEANSRYAFDEHADLYLADERANVLYLREEYEQVEVT